MSFTDPSCHPSKESEKAHIAASCEITSLTRAVYRLEKELEEKGDQIRVANQALADECRRHTEATRECTKHRGELFSLERELEEAKGEREAFKQLYDESEQLSQQRLLCGVVLLVTWVATSVIAASNIF